MEGGGRGTGTMPWLLRMYPSGAGQRNGSGSPYSMGALGAETTLRRSGESCGVMGYTYSPADFLRGALGVPFTPFSCLLRQT